MSLEKLLGRKAIVILYEEDLSSTQLKVVDKIDKTVLHEIADTWLGLVITADGNECKFFIVSRGNIVDGHSYDCNVYMYLDREAILKRDSELAKKIIDVVK